MNMYLVGCSVICQACIDGNHISYGHDHRNSEEGRSDCKNVGTLGSTLVQCSCTMDSGTNLGAGAQNNQ